MSHIGRNLRSYNLSNEYGEESVKRRETHMKNEPNIMSVLTAEKKLLKK